MTRTKIWIRIAALLAVLALACGARAQMSSVKTVFIILMENHNWSQIKGSSSAPYINNTLLPMASHAEDYNNPPGIHPSLPNYLWLEAGTNFGITNDDDPSVNHQSTTLHLVTQLNNAGITWKAYEEGISGTTCPLTSVNNYAPKHNPFVYFDDVTNTNDPNSAYCIAHVRPYTELANDLANKAVAQYNFITPNLCDDMHDSCAPLNNPVAQGDTWLSNEVPKILNSTAYQNGGALFITWDEAASGDGPIGMIVLSPLAKGGGYSNSIYYEHGSTLRTFEEIFGQALIRDAANQTDLSDLFSSTGPPAPTGLTATPGNAQATLNWNPSAGAVSYNVKRALVSGGPYATIQSGVTATTYTDTGLTNGTIYYYVVSAVNGSGESPNSNQASATPFTAGTPVYQINSGGAAVSPFEADTFFSGGQKSSTTAAVSTAGVTNPAPMAVYQTWRQGVHKSSTFKYTLPGLTAGTTYTVRLHFAENVVSAAGARKFNVSSFDVFAAAGGKNKAVVEQFGPAANASGQIVIQFSAVTSKNGPIVNGIEVIH